MKRPPVLYLGAYEALYVDASLVRDLCAARGKAATSLRQRLQSLLSDPQHLPDGKLPAHSQTVEEKRAAKSSHNSR